MSSLRRQTEPPTYSRAVDDFGSGEIHGHFSHRMAEKCFDGMRCRAKGAKGFLATGDARWTQRCQSNLSKLNSDPRKAENVKRAANICERAQNLCATLIPWSTLSLFLLQSWFERICLSSRDGRFAAYRYTDIKTRNHTSAQQRQAYKEKAQQTMRSTPYQQS
jgi:hypothetical protein